jgi:hypothetical protein
MATASSALACAALCAATVLAPAPARAQAAPAHDGLHDFDFLAGHWHAHLRRLVGPLTGSTQWIEYEGTLVMAKVWDGRANMEDFKVAAIPRDAQAAAAAKRPSIDAQTLRLYDPGTGLWSIWLVDAAHGKLGTPATVGSFHDDRGEFFDAEDFNGRTVVVRYVWTRPTPTTAHFEQAFSPDWGRTWEVNWILDVTPHA